MLKWCRSGAKLKGGSLRIGFRRQLQSFYNVNLVVLRTSSLDVEAVTIGGILRSELRLRLLGPLAKLFKLQLVNVEDFTAGWSTSRKLWAVKSEGVASTLLLLFLVSRLLIQILVNFGGIHRRRNKLYLGLLGLFLELWLILCLILLATLLLLRLHWELLLIILSIKFTGGVLRLWDIKLRLLIWRLCSKIIILLSIRGGGGGGGCSTGLKLLAESAQNLIVVVTGS